MSEDKKCCDSKDEKNCKDKNEKNCKRAELESQIENLSNELDLAKKTIEEQKSTITSYLSTASYYKNELDNQKKDFDRYKERNKNFESEMAVKANESIAKKLLPIIDNFDQAIAHVSDVEILKGFSMIYSSLVSTLSDIGVVEIVCKDELLNPEYHNCISTEETDDESLNDKIACIYQKGYMFAESKQVVRPATVSVYKAKTE